MSCRLLQIPSLWRILIVALLSLQCRSSDPASDNASIRKGEPLVNSIGKVLPLHAAPLHQQILRHMLPEPRTLDVSINNYDAAGSLTIYDPLLKMNTSILECNNHFYSKRLYLSIKVFYYKFKRRYFKHASKHKILEQLLYRKFKFGSISWSI